MDRQNIIIEITKIVGTTDFGEWRIGLSHEPQERRIHWKDTEKNDVSCWTIWIADSLVDAKAIEQYFVSVKGMKNGSNGDALSLSKVVFAYIF
jgi:hypothetical protein